MKTLIVFLTVLLLNSVTVYASDGYKPQLTEFLKTQVTLHFTEEERQALYNSARSEYDFFSFTDGVNFYDIDNDSIPEIFLNIKIYDGSVCEIYKLVEGEYISVGLINGEYKLYTDSSKKISVLEGGNSGDIMYSRVYLNNNSLLKDTVYCEGSEFYNRLNDKKLGNKIFEDIRLLDNIAFLLNSMNFNMELNLAKNEVRKELKLDTSLPNISIIINNAIVPPHTNPIITDNRVFVPVRTIAEGLGAEVLWDSAKREVTVNNGGDSIRFTIGSQTAYLNNKATTLDTKPFIKEDRVLLPMRFVVEMLNGKVAWSAKTRTVFIQHGNVIKNSQGLDDVLVATTHRKDIADNFKNTISIVLDSGSETSIFWSNVTLTDMKIHEVEWDEQGTFISKKIIRTINKFNPSDLLSIQSIVPEGIPKTGITYTDSFGNKRAFVIGYNGRFGGISFVEVKME